MFRMRKPLQTVEGRLVLLLIIPWCWSMVAVVVVDGSIPPDGLCDLNVVLPFTIRMNKESESISTGFFTKSRLYSLGYSHLASAVMAMKHFNERDGRIVPELESDEIMGGCNVQFGMNDMDVVTNNQMTTTPTVNGTRTAPSTPTRQKTIFLDTGTIGNLGNSLLFQEHFQRRSKVCGIAGPYYDNPGRNVATLAAAAMVPHVPHGGYSIALAMPTLAPMTTLMTPEMIQLGQALSTYLLRIQRNNFISFLHPLTELGTQTSLVMGVMFNMYKIRQWEDFSYMSEFFNATEANRSIPMQMQKVKERGFRTIVVMLDPVGFVADIPTLANAANTLGMLDGDYVWIFIPIFEKAAIHNAIQLPEFLLESQGIPSYAHVTKLLQGAALLTDIEQHHYLGDQDPFLRVWKEQGPHRVQLINYMYANATIQAGTKDYLMTGDFFQTFGPEDGAGKMYDSVMSIGLGACKAQKENKKDDYDYGFSDSAIDGKTHRDAIRSLEFSGATGRVKFGDRRRINTTKDQIRTPPSAAFGLYNLFPPFSSNSSSNDHGDDNSSSSEPAANDDKDWSFDEAFVLTEVLTDLEGPFAPEEDPALGTWTQYGPSFVYADGRVEPPKLLRDVPEQNYLSKGLRVAGLSFMGVSLLACAISMAFVINNWNHRVIRASQPKFLCLLLIGAAVTSLAIITISFDESYGWDEEALSKACMATPWLFCCGHIITYGALFSKLWRINKVLQFTRRKISAAAVAGPMASLLLATVVILAVWTIHDPLEWVRTTVNQYTGESIGQCQSDSMKIYLPLLVVVMAVPTVLTCVFAWKTKDVDETFTESSWIFTLIITQIQVIIVSFPIVILLRDSSTDGRYIGLALLITIFPSSTVILIMCPKFVAYFQNGMSVSSRTSDVRRSRGASSGGVRVSGISGLSGGSSEVRHHTSEMGSAFVNRDCDSKRVSFAGGDKLQSTHNGSTPTT